MALSMVAFNAGSTEGAGGAPVSVKRVVVWNGEEANIGAGWVNPKTCSIGPQSAEAHSGNTALEFKFKGGNQWLGAGWNWCHFKTGTNVGTDASAMRNLTFWIKTKGKAGDLQVNLLCNGAVLDTPEEHTVKVPVAGYCPHFLDGQWHEVVIPLADLNQIKGFNPKIISEIHLGFKAGQEADGSFFIDDISFDDRVGGAQPVAVSVADGALGPELAPRFLGLSYEMSMLLPKDGRYYFDPNDHALVNSFKTLGIKSLRVGANAVDDPRIPVPQEKDIDELFNFARAAGVQVIYSFRLKNGDPADSARLAGYIAAHDADALDCYSIGNEPNFFLKTYEAFFAEWKPHYDAILKAVPLGMIDGPSANAPYAVRLARDLFAEGHLKMVSDHYYFLGSGRLGEKNPPETRARFLSNSLHKDYEKAWAALGAVLAAQGVPYRIDELNSCYNGGAKNSSDTYASTLWALDCTHWWAAHHIQGMNYHTGESVGRDETFGAANYAAFVHQPKGKGFNMRPQAYAYLAFSQGAQGRPLPVQIQTAPAFDFNAYAYRDKDGSIYLTLINKSYGDKAQLASVTVVLPKGAPAGVWQRMDLAQIDHDIAAKAGVKLGGAAISPQGTWSGRWKKVKAPPSGNTTVEVAPASATILRLSPGK